MIDYCVLLYKLFRLRLLLCFGFAVWRLVLLFCFGVVVLVCFCVVVYCGMIVCVDAFLFGLFCCWCLFDGLLFIIVCLNVCWCLLLWCLVFVLLVACALYCLLC